MKIPKTKLQIAPRKMIQGTVLYGQKCVSKKRIMPTTTAVHPEVNIASTTEKIAYLDYALLILITVCFKLLSNGRQKRPILPNS